MRILSIICFTLAAGCEAFAYWGLRTLEGQRTFDEMAGMVPLATGFFGAILALIALFTWWWGRRSGRRPPTPPAAGSR